VTSCSGDDTSSDPKSGSGGSNAQAGSPSKNTGGSTATGGSKSSGGSTSSGGSNSTGGTSNDGTGGGNDDSGGSGGDGPASGGSDATGGSNSSAGSGGGGSGGTNTGTPLAKCLGGSTPPNEWKEHWFEHNQTVKLVYQDDCVAVYFDDAVDREKAKWIFDFVSKVWSYSLATYGQMGKERTYFIFHQGKYYGGHPSYWYDASHDNRNLSDVGGADWAEGPNYDVTSHEVAHIVESTAFYPKRGSPGFRLWGDSKWAEFYQYDLYVALGMTKDAERVFKKFSATSDSLPPGAPKKAFWFRDWFYPLWKDYGGAQVMVKFYHLIRDNTTSDRVPDLNVGEYVHFTSGAAGANVQPLAEKAFGWKSEWTTQLAEAKKKYPKITY
jgi:hypothetical protein